VRAAAALDVLPPGLADQARARLTDADQRVRAAALGYAGRHPEPFAPDRLQLERALGDADVRVRTAAVRALAAAGPGATQALGRALGDAAGEVRRAAVAAVVSCGEAGAEVARRRLAPEETGLCREAALEVLQRVGSRDARVRLAAELRSAVRGAWEALLALRALPERGPLALRFLRAAESDALTSALKLAFRVLSLLEDAAVTRTVERTIRFGPERLRFEALEVLSHLGEREVAAQLVLLLEPAPIEEKLSHLGSFVRRPGGAGEVITEAREGATRWLHAAAHTADGGGPDSYEEARLMERLVFLRGVALFSNLSLEQLEAIEKLTHEEPYVEGERVVREGDPGENLYLVVEGELGVWRGHGGDQPQRLNTLGPGSYFGEMSILDHRPRSASVVTSCASRLLVLEGGRLRELILDQPEIAFEIFRVLTARVRAAEARLPG
jgi:hypothetical protein